MSVSKTFDRKFNKSMRGYNTEEVDAALDALLRYCDELEDANREFEIANNDLIDDKTELNKKIQGLNSEKAALEQKLTEITERVAHVEGLYNSYREKFGEARDMITKAKSSAAEIIARAQAKAEIISEEAAKKHKAQILEFDRETKKRRALIEKLDICYNEFSDTLKKELSEMLGRVESFAVVPTLPDGLPEKSISDVTDVVDTENDEDIKLTLSADMQQPVEVEIEIIEEPKMTPYDLDVTDENNFDQATHEEKDQVRDYIDASSKIDSVFSTGSKVSDIKNSLSSINQKVLKKKSTPHI